MKQDRLDRASAFWLMKSEPAAFSIDDLAARPGQSEPWNGVRNYQARNMLRDQMRVGDLAFFYHSSCPQPGIVGIVKIIRAGYADPTSWDVRSAHFDPRSTPQAPRWYMVDVQLVRKTRRMITLSEIKTACELAALPLVKPGNRLSIMPVAEEQWNFILALE